MKPFVFCLLLFASVLFGCAGELQMARVLDSNPPDDYPIPDESGQKLTVGVSLETFLTTDRTMLIIAPAWIAEGDTVFVAGPYIHSHLSPSEFYIAKKVKPSGYTGSQRDGIRARFRHYRGQGNTLLQRARQPYQNYEPMEYGLRYSRI